MNENSLSNTHTAATTTRWFCQKLQTVQMRSNSASRKRKKLDENFEDHQTNAAGNRVIANPNVINTQIAKISYVPPVVLNTPMGSSCISSNVHTAKINFVQKRKERDTAIQEFKSALNQLNRSSKLSETKNEVQPSYVHHSVQTEMSENVSDLPNGVECTARAVSSRGTVTAPNSFRRAQTELQMQRQKSLTTRTKSSNQIELARSGTARTTSSGNRMLDSANRKSSYDPTAARRYMKTQQKRRQSSSLKPGQEDAIKKEEIKKRLEDLKKQSRLIVSKNIKKQKSQIPNKKEVYSVQDILEPCQNLSQPESPQMIAVIKDYAGQVPSSTKRSETIVSTQENSNENENLVISLSAGSRSSKSVRTVQSELSEVASEKTCGSAESAKDVPEVPCNRRVGILRKPESKDHSFSHIADFSFEKENVAIEMLTPQIPPPNIEKKMSQLNSETNSNHLTIPISNDTPKSIKPQLLNEEHEQNHLTLPISNDTPKSIKPQLLNEEHEQNHLTIPISNDTPKSMKPQFLNEEHEHKFTQVHSNSSLMQKAQSVVTKKEANIQTEEPNDQTEVVDLPFWLRPSSVQVYPYNFIQAVRRKLLSIAEHTPSADIIEAAPAKNEATSTRDLVAVKEDRSLEKTEPVSNSKPASFFNGNMHKSPTISDLNSNITSISIQPPISNTVSEVSSLKSESAFKSHTISKSVSYQDKDDTTISSSVFSSPEKRKKLTNTTNSNRSDQYTNQSVSPLSLEEVEKLQIQSKSTSKSNERKANESNKNLDFNKLLSDFNHGLSQVIEANEQLKSTLDKSQLILSPKSSAESKKNCVSHTETYTTDFEELTHTTTISAQCEKQSKRKLLKTTTPLLKSPKKSEQTNVGTNLDFQLDLASVTPSSVHSSELLTNSTTTVADESSIPDFEIINKTARPENTSTQCSAHEERLATIDQLKENLRRMIKESQDNRKTLVKDNSSSSSKTQSAIEKKNKSTSGEHKKSTSKEASKNSPRESSISLNTANSASISGLHHSSEVTLTNTTFSLGETNASPVDKSESSHFTKFSYKPKQHKSNDDTSSAINTITEKTQKNAQETSYKNNNANAAWNYRNINASSNNRLERISKVKRSKFEVQSDHIQNNKNLLSTQKSPPQNYTSDRKIESPTSVKTLDTAASIRTTCSSEIVTLLKVADLDLSHISSCNVSLSESSSFNYSSVGLYEKLIKSEITKSDHLAGLLKMREKALLDRTKGQVAWLQVQKERCKSKGLLMHIAEIRKKQRAILLKMSKEREEIKRLLQSALSIPSDLTSSTRLRGGESTLQKGQLQTDIHQPPTLLPLTPRSTSVESRRCRPRDRRRDSYGRHSSAAPTVLRATHELESSASVEALLRQREEDLRRRREYCERLLEWHRKLDEEELEVYNLERQLFDNQALQGDEGCSTRKSCCSKAIEQLRDTVTTTRTSEVSSKNSTAPTIGATEMERRLKEIDKSLRELNSISATTNIESTSLSNGQETTEANLDFVRTTGSKLNKLWRRLTSQQLEKFEPTRRYKLCKADLERLYEEAKLAVLTDFSNVEERSLLLERSGESTINIHETSIGSARDLINAINAESTINERYSINNNNIDVGSDCEPQNPVPSLSLNLSTSPSAEDPENSQNLKTGSETFSISKSTTGDYSPSTAERNFRDDNPVSSVSSSATTTVRTPTSNNETVSNAACEAKLRSELIKKNLQKFLRSTSKAVSNQNEQSLERSLSDTEIDRKAIQKNYATNNGAPIWTPEKRNFIEAPQSPVSATATQKSADTLQSVASLESNTSSIVEGINIPTSSASSSSEWKSCRYYREEAIKSSKSCSKENTQTRPTVIKKTGETTPLSIETISLCNTKSIAEKTEMVSNTTEPQQITNEFDTKSNEIAAKLNEITEAVARLSQSNSLGKLPASNGALKKNTNLNQNQKEFEGEYENQSQQSNSQNISNTTTASQSDDFSYSTNFESSLLSKQNDAARVNLMNQNDTVTKASKRTENDNGTPQSSFDQSSLENCLLDCYEFNLKDTTADETMLDEVSMPFLETTFDTTGTNLNLEDIDDIEPLVIEHQEELENMSASNAITTPTKPHIQNNLSAIALITDNQTLQQQQQQQSLPQQLMPDIINELEIRRCQQILLESDHLRQYEQVAAVPYVYVREIPNKPPPPYCPPAHGSPMTTIFPSEERIKDITFRRTHELYCEILKTDHINEKGEKLPSVLDEKITNIYERIVLDICREYLEEHNEVLNPQSDPSNFHSQLAFFNPPDRLRCIQESIYKDVRRCLGMDKTLPKRTPVYSIYGQRAKRDHIGQIIIQEMYEEDEKWCSFYHEEDEVLELIIEEMIGQEISKIAKTVLVEEGVVLGTTEILSEVIADESDVVSNCSQVENSAENSYNNAAARISHEFES